MTGIASRLNKLKGNLTLKEFSGRCGIRKAMMQDYLKGRDMPLDMLVMIVKTTGCSTDWLLGIKDTPSGGNDKIKLSAYISEMQAIADGINKFINDFK